MGVLWTVLLNGCLGLAAYLTARFGLRQPAGAPRGLAAATLAWAWATLGMELLGPLGLLAREPLLAWVASGLVMGTVCWLTRRGTPESPELPARWSWIEIATIGLLIWTALLWALPSLLLPVKVVSDGPIYHLYFAARWWKSHRLEWIAAPFGANHVTYFPAVGDLWFSWLMVGWGGPTLAKVGQAPFYLLAAFSMVALARRLGAGREAAIVAMAWCLTAAPLLLFTFEGNVDTIFLSGYVLSAYFFTRHLLRDDGPAALLLGGLAAGCTMATKVHGVVFVPPLLVVAAGSAIAHRAGRVRLARDLLILALAPLTIAGFWYGRLWWETGNPLYPVHLVVFNRVVLAGWYGTDVMKLSQYYLPREDWRAFIDIVLGVLDPRLAVVWLAAVAGAWALGRREGRDRRLDRGVGLLAALVVVNVAIYWLLIPYRTQQRFMFHPVALSVAPLARLFNRARWLTVVGCVLLAVHLFTPQGWPAHDPLPWDLSSLVPNAVSALIALPLRIDGFVSLVPWLLGVIAFGMAWMWGRAGTRRGNLVATLATALGLAGAVAILYPHGASAPLLFYPRFPEYVRGWLEFEQRVGPRGARVAYAGNDLPFYLMGVGLRNEVRYINIDAHRDWLLHDYHRAACEAAGHVVTWQHPCPGWDRIHPDYDAWLDNLRAEGIQILVVNRCNPAEGLHNIADRAGFPIERQWAEGHPEQFQPLYGVAENDPQFRIYRVRTRSNSSDPPG